jgi:hypothetical protein
MAYQLRYTAFVLLMLSINLIDGLVTPSIEDPERRMLVAVAATFDVVVLVTALYYWLLVRPGIRGRTSLAVVALTSVVRATFLYPNAAGMRAVITGVCEAGLIGFVFVHLRHRKQGAPERALDPLEAIRAALANVVFVPVLLNAIAAEATILYYALFSWRAKPHIPVGTRAFTIYRKVGQTDLLDVLPIACALEMIPVHLLLKQWSATVAWISTGLTLYGVIWLVGIARAFRLRPVLVGRDYVYLRYGLLFELRIPADTIGRLRRARVEDRSFAVPRKSDPTVCIELLRPLYAQGLFLLGKRVTKIGVTPDDQVAFVGAVAGLTTVDD